ncbi:MAG: hypothetical protein AAF502_13060 [Bacteroidota bacterium]
MNNPLFSNGDKVLFFDALKNINDFLHHVKYYDRTNDVLELFDGIKKQMWEASDSVEQLFGKMPKELTSEKNTGKPEDEVLKDLIEHFRHNTAFEDQFDGFKERLFKTFFKGKQKKWDSFIESFGEVEEKKNLAEKGEKKLKLLVRKIHQARIRIIESLEVIFQKLAEIQSDREKFRSLLAGVLEERNERIYETIRDLEECRNFFENIDEKYFEKLENDLTANLEEQRLEVNQLINSFVGHLINIRIHLNNLHVEQNKMRAFVPYYPAFREEVLKGRSSKVRNSKYSKANLQKILESIGYKITGGNYDFYFDEAPEKNRHKTANINADNEIVEKTPGNTQINAVALANSLVQIKEETESKFKETESQFKESKIEFRTLQILKNITSEGGSDGMQYFLNNLNKELKSLKIHKKINWSLIEDYSAVILKGVQIPGRDGASDQTDIVKYRLNWKLNDILERANFIFVLNTIELLVRDIFDQVQPGKGWEKKKNVFYEKETFNPNLKIPDNADPRDILKELKKIVLGTISQDGSQLNNKFPYINAEIKYFINCLKGFTKRYNNRLFSRKRIVFKAYRVKNKTIKGLFEGRKYSFSSFFRNIIFEIDQFFEHHFENTLNNKNKSKAFLEFDKLYSYVRLSLEEHSFGRFNIINQYLHSNQFIKLLNKLQLYGAAFGIWDEEGKELVRLQDRRYCKKNYRPSQKDFDDKWYDIPELVFNGERWAANEFEESIDLTFLAQRGQILPEFFQNLNKKKNLLNDVDKANNCLFSEDGEISAFALLYRFLNTVCNSTEEIDRLSIEEKNWLALNDPYALEGIAAIVSNLHELGKHILDENLVPIIPLLDHIEGFPCLEKVSDKNLKSSFGYQVFDYWVKKFQSEVFDKSNEVQKYKFDFLKNETQTILGLVSYIMINVCLCDKVIFSPKFRSEAEVRIFLSGDGNKLKVKKDDGSYFLLDLKHEDFHYFISHFKFLLKKILQQLIISLIRKPSINLNYSKKSVDSEQVSNAFDHLEFSARIEKFNWQIENRVPITEKNFYKELERQGFTKKVSETPGPKDLILATERYSNLCLFIEKELNPAHRPLKLKCDFPKEFCSPINSEGYFIDKQTSKIKALIENKNDQIYKFELQFRETLLNEINLAIRDVTDVATPNNKLSIEKFGSQIASILSLLMEPVQHFLTCTNENSNFLKHYSALCDPENKGKKTELRGKLWQGLKDHIDRLTKIPISASYLWRANNEFAHSELVMPLASTSTSQGVYSVGFLILGLRNIYEDSKGKMVHVTHKNANHFSELLYTIRTIFEPLIHPFMDKIYYEQFVVNSVKKNAMVAGGAQVMARNLSHNIGSHVLGNLVSGKSIYSHLTTKYETLFKEKNEDGKKINKRFDWSHLVMIADLMSYKRERMALIADISTSAPQFITTKPFEDIFKDFYDCDDNNVVSSQNLLLDFISGLNGKHSDSIKIEMEEGSEVNVGLPHDELGAQALYVIFENLIRNAFKHTKLNDNEENEISFEKLLLKVGISEVSENYRFSGSKPDLWELKIKVFFLDENDNEIGYQSIPQIESPFKAPKIKLHDYLQELIQAPMLDESTKSVRMSNWGFLEMKIAAGYLRRKSIAEIDEKHQFPLLKTDVINVTNSATNEKYYYLEYKIFLEKPKDIYFLTNNLTSEFAKLNDKFSNSGILVTDTKTVQNKINEENRETDYDFLVTGQFKGFNLYQRIIPLDSFQFDTIEKFNDLIQEAWVKWMLVLSNYKKQAMKTRLVFASLKNKKENEIEKEFRLEDYVDEVGENSGHRIIFDDHGDCYSRYCNAQSDPKDVYIYYKGTSRLTQHCIDGILSNEKGGYPNKAKSILIEAGNLGIAVIDERIQLGAKENSEIGSKTGVTIQQVLEKSRIFIPKVTGEDGLDLGNFASFTKVGLKGWIEKRINEIDYILVHIGLLEMLSNSTAKDLEEFLKFYQEKGKHVIFTSGRGLPSNLPQNSYFLNASIVSKYIFAFDKASLVQVLYSLRRVKKK